MILFQYINITMEVISIIFLGALGTVMLLRRRSMGFEPFLFAIVVVHAVNTAGDLLAWLFDAADTSLANALTSVGNGITYFFGPFVYTAFALYVCVWITGRKELSAPFERVVASAIIFIGALDLVCLLMNFSTGVLYSINAYNVFSWGPWASLPAVTVLAQNLIVAFVALHEDERNVARAFGSWVLLLGIPVLAASLELAFRDLMLVYPALSLSLLMAHMEFQHRQEQQLVLRNLELTESQAKALSSQITSHFVFNALQSVRELCVVDPQCACKAIDDFSDYLRGNLQVVNAGGTVTLAEEVKHVKAYLAVEQIDPSSEFSVKWDLLAKDFDLPPLCVQPLVENAVRHGISGIEGGVIKVSSWEDSSAYYICVADNGRGFGDSPTTGKHVGIALQNVRSRLALLCEGTLSVVSSPEGTKATITIPKRRS